jgi:outer membrane biosynthesis protein TonB
MGSASLMEASPGHCPKALLHGVLGALALHGALFAMSAFLPGERAASTPPQPQLVWLQASELPAPSSAGSVAQEPRALIGQREQPVRTKRVTKARAQACATRAPASAEPSLAVDGFVRAQAPEATSATAKSSAQGSSSLQGERMGAASVGGATIGTGDHAAGKTDGAAAAGSAAPRAQLLSSHPCAGYFPGAATADVGEVQVDIVVDASGHAARSSVLIERPSGQGFAQAAQACAPRLLFAPAHDGTGAAVPARAKLKLVFKRA